MTEEERKEFMKEHSEIKVDGGKVVNPLYRNEQHPNWFKFLKTFKSKDDKHKNTQNRKEFAQWLTKMKSMR